MTKQDRDFIETIFERLREQIESLKNLFEEKVSSIKKAVEKGEYERNDLYNKHRLLERCVAEVKLALTNHTTNHDVNDKSKRSTIGIIAQYAAIIAAIAIAVFK